MGIKAFFKKAFGDMKESTKAQHEVDKANFAAAKQKAWLSICGSLGGGMLLFMMVSMITPLGSTIINVALCAVGGALFAFGLGAISKVVLKKTSLV